MPRTAARESAAASDLGEARVPVSLGRPLPAAGGTLTGRDRERRAFSACAERAQPRPAPGGRLARDCDEWSDQRSFAFCRVVRKSIPTIA